MATTKREFGITAPTEREFDINGVHYVLTLTPKDQGNGKRIPLLRGLRAFCDGDFKYTEVRGKVQGQEQLGPPGPTNPVTGRFKEICGDALRTNFTQLEIILKGHPRQIIIERTGSYSDSGSGYSDTRLIQGRGRRKTETVLS